MKVAAIVLILLQLGVIHTRHISNTDLEYNRTPETHRACADACMRQEAEVRTKCVDCCHSVEGRERWGMCIARYAKLHVNLIHHVKKVI